MLKPPFKSELQPLSEEDKKVLLPLYNPLIEEFKFDYTEDDNSIVNLSMAPGEITYFPTHKARFMAKHLADEMVNQGKEGLREQYLKEIWVKI